MDIILCHTTADFDTLGAAIGLCRLLPGSRIVLAAGAHPAVRDFLALHRDEYPLIERRSVTPQQIKSIHIVDTQQRSRLGKAAEWLDLKHLQGIFVYDHHPTGSATTSTSDITATHWQIEPVGAATTLIVEKLQAEGVVPTAIEATGMALGIHVDTGSLTFDHSTARDATALAWLMEQGANVRAIAEYLDPGFSPALQELLTQALETLTTETIQGQVLSWVLLATGEFVPGLSSLASRLMEITESGALLLGMHYPIEKSSEKSSEERVIVIGRSHIQGTDLSRLFTPLGGGGHPKAATVSLRGVEPKTLMIQLCQQLAAQIPVPLTARELMSSPVRTIRPQTSIAEAQRILLRYGHSGLSVVNAKDQLVGIISRRDLDLALHHGFGHAPVKAYMTLNPKTIAPTTSLPEIERLMVTYDIGRLPVLQEDQLVGIVTRTDVLRQLHQEQQKPNTHAGERFQPYCLHPEAVQGMLRTRLKPPLRQLLETAAHYAQQRGWHLYLVGGGVRDLLLAHPGESLAMTDIDLVVDGFHQAVEAGAGVELARDLRSLYPQARLEVHGSFQTAALLWHNDPHLKSLWVDIATARTEFYPYPAANPEVEASSIQQDLYRRDFTINALAIRLTRPRAGELLDFFGGLLDLDDQVVRVLHANSFIEDPTRIYRAVRFAVRLGFQIEPRTLTYIRYALNSGIYERTQGENPIAPALQTRLRAELKYILGANYWKPALQLLGNLRALRCLHPSLELTSELWRKIRLVEFGVRGSEFGVRKSEVENRKSEVNTIQSSSDQTPNSELQTPNPKLQISPWLLRLEVLIAELGPEYRSKVATKLQLPADSIQRLDHLAEAIQSIQERLKICQKPSEIVANLHSYDVAMLMLVLVNVDRPCRKLIWRYLTHWLNAKPPLNGHDLKRMGYKPGKHFKLILDDLLAAYLDGQLGEGLGSDESVRSAAQAFLKQHYPSNS
jgi:tRNA nucleotidyltransferase (CCA-adding enzyme)